MSILYMDGFDHYGTGQTTGIQNMFGGPWTGSAGGNVAAPAWGPARTGAFAYGNGGGLARRILPAAKAQVFMSLGYALDSLPFFNTASSIMTFRDGANVVLANLYVDTTGALRLCDKDNTTLAVTSGPILIARNWHFIEVLWDKTGGAFTVRVDDANGTETPAMHATGLTFANNCAQITVNESLTFGEAVQGWVDDVLIRDTLGSVNNGWLGDRRVATLFANADTTTAGWTPSYYQKFGPGILRCAYRIAGQQFDQQPSAFVDAGPSTQLDIGPNDFTLETEIRFDALPQGALYATIFNRWDTTGDHRSYRLTYGGPSFNNSCLQWDTSTDGTNSTVTTPIVFPWAPETDVWYHLAIVRAAGELLLFIDGVQQGLPVADSSTYYSGGTEIFAVGSQNASGANPVANTYVCGRFDETRFTNGVGRYTGTFTPPSAAFPRGSSDPYWSDVVLLMGYDSAVNDESSFARTIDVRNGAISFIPSDGPAVGVFSTVNKAAPDDNTFISASFTPASNILTMTTNPANNDTITLGTTDGTTPAVYTYKTATPANPFEVFIGATAADSLANFLNAVNTGPGAGTAYGTGTTANFDVTGASLPIDQIEVTAAISGTVGNSIVSTATGTAAVWGSTTLLGGQDIPGPTSFKLQRPPNNTTIISGLQINVRALKTDAGLADIQSGLIGGQGTEDDGSIHALTTSVNYYTDIFESDPDTGGPISPTTIINGQVIINRTT